MAKRSKKKKVWRKRRVLGVGTQLAPTPPPDDAYSPEDGSANKHSEYRKLEDQETIPAEKRRYYGRTKT